VTITTIITNEWMTFKDLEQALGIPGPSLRRWNEKFPTFLGGKRINRVLSFPRESLEVFKMIQELFKEGKDSSEVVATLSREMNQTHDVKPIPRDEPPSSPSGLPSPAPGSGMDFGQLVPILVKIAENQAKALDMMERRLAVLETIAARIPLSEAVGGHQNAREGQGRGNVHNQPTEAQEGPDMTREEKIRLVHELHAAGKGGRATASELNRRGIRTLSGKGRWAAGSVKRILKGGAGHGE